MGILEAAIIFGGYVSGSIPFGVLICRYFLKIDPREHGSGNIGATNVGRIAGWKWGVLILLLDCLKGLLPTWFLPMLIDTGSRTHWAVFTGLAAVIGHSFPIWLRFRGGKGVATSLGVLGAIALRGLGVSFGVFALTLLLFRTVSLSSILSAIAFATFQMYLLSPDPFQTETRSLAIVSLLLPMIVIWQHRSNIARLLRGEEPTIHSAEKKMPTEETPGGESASGRTPSSKGRND